LFLDIVEGRDPDVGKDPYKIKIGVEVYQEGNQKITKKTILLAKFQERLFYLGIISFIAWHVLEMYFVKSK
jgi:hypothetical protein